MKVTQVSLCPSEAAQQMQRPALTPELLAACGARYSRNNEGLDAILAKIDPQNLDKSVDSIFRMVDYGHQSIADMVPVAIFMDGISIWLAYYLWTLCPTAGGQESSTRYIKISLDGLIPPDKLGITPALIPQWSATMTRCFDAYQNALTLWENIAQNTPEVIGLPKALLSDTTEIAKKKVARLKRNYAFDRARYFLPVAAQTNMMMVMSARGWVQLCQVLLSHPLSEANQLGNMLKQELALTAPRLIKHAVKNEAVQQNLNLEFTKWLFQSQIAQNSMFKTEAGIPFLETMSAQGIAEHVVKTDLSTHPHRYAPVGSSLQRMSVRFGWSSVSFAEIRDLNRHRTGNKYCPLVPQGFYYALEQLPPAFQASHLTQLEQAAQVAKETLARATQYLNQADPTYIYWTVLGAEYPFEHLTTADKFIYEAELRTGLGAHYRYAKHLRDVLALFYQKYPQTKGLIIEGSAEPE